MLYSEAFTLASPASVGVTTDTGGVAAVNEVQELAIDATGGTFTVTFDGQTTGALAYDISTADLQTALIGLSNLAPGDVVVTGAAGAYVLTFGGTLAGTNVAEITANGAGLTGGASTAVPSTTTPGVAAVNEVQTVTVTATGGTFTLTFDGQTTSALTFPPTAAEVKAALEALSNIAASDLTVTRTGPTGNAYAYEVTFGGTLAATNVAQISGTATGLVDATLIATGQTREHEVLVLASSANARLGGTPADAAYPIPTGSAAEGVEVCLTPGRLLYAASTSGTPTVYVFHSGLKETP